MSQPAPPTYRTTPWRLYNAALKRRGSLPIWLDPRTERLAAPSGQRGREILRAPRPLGRARWTRWSGHRRRSRAEAKMHRLKPLGERLMARTGGRPSAEPQIRAAVLNRFAALGTPETHRVA